jgi:hypothetical protein
MTNDDRLVTFAQLTKLSNVFEEDRYINSAQLRQMFGGISEMTVWRWERLAEDPLPEAVWINGRKYRSLAELRAWRKRRAKQAA